MAIAHVPSEVVKGGYYESSTSAILHLEVGDKVYVGDCDDFNFLDLWTVFNGVLLNKD